jgi:hypothetical protein
VWTSRHRELSTPAKNPALPPILVRLFTARKIFRNAEGFSAHHGIYNDGGGFFA